MSASTINVVNKRLRARGLLPSQRFASACLVLGAHLAVIGWLASRTIDMRRAQVAAQPMVAEILAAARSESPLAGMQLLPNRQTIQLDVPLLEVSAQPEVSIDAPRIDPALAVDIAPYSAKADLVPGLIATVLLLLEIGPDGSVLSAKIVRSNAGEAANAAAIQYAHATHWMPGKIGGEPRAMEASLTVILGERG